ncbi:AAA family ATPase [Mycobacterium sp. AT1]|uniref:AAA family ATPase n=1 Tax=Mycobacterium sp. AT1 TaxID=1961706 RepID=UPI0009AE9498|nr:AAA family ATPase [Mycobacterium sp. AT1]OPX10208.1 hypothetical protein B1790_13595 [Mycobacterium sp. AT1]
MTPTAFFVIGPAGSGKSTVSRAIAHRYGAAYLNKDTLATTFTEYILHANGFDENERDNNEFYQNVVMPLEYETLLRTCGDNLRLGTSVVLDAPFGRYFADRGYLETAARQYDWPDAELVVVHVKADGDTVFNRVVERRNGRDNWKVEHWDEFWKTQHTECLWDSAHHLVVDNDGPVLDLTAFDQAVAAITTKR